MSRRVPSASAPNTRSKSRVVCIDTTIRLYCRSVNPSPSDCRCHHGTSTMCRMEQHAEPGHRDLDEGELARRSAVRPERIRKLVRIGVLQPDSDGRFEPADVQRVQIVAAFVDAGIELRELADAVSERRMSFEFIDRIY